MKLVARSAWTAALVPVLRRLRLARRTGDIAWIAAAGFGAATVGVVLERVTAGGPYALYVGVAAAFGVAAARTVASRRRPLDLLVAARHVERDGWWRERLSTVLEHGERDGVVVAALVRDTERAVTRMGDRATSATPWPLRAGIAALAAVTALGATASWWPDRTAPAAAPSTEQLQSLAEAVADHAAEYSDGYIAALAERLNDLAIRAAEAPLDADGRAEVEHVLEALAVAAPGLDIDALRGLLSPRTAARPGGASEDTAGATPTGPREYESQRTPGTTAAAQGEFRAELIDTVDEDAMIHPDALAGAAAAADIRPEGRFDPAMLDSAMNAAPGSGTPPPDALAELLGGAEEAGAGESQLAGGGTKPFEGAVAGPELVPDAMDAVAVAGQEREDGRRVDVELPPEAEWTAYDPDAFEVGPWRAAPESAVTSDAVPLRHRAAAGRYFLPSQATASSR